MARSALDHYLNDHLGGSTAGSRLAAHVRGRSAGTPLGEVMATVAPQIEEDRRTLVALMTALGTPRNRLKEAAGRLGEEVGRLKFRGVTSGDPGFGLFMALETLVLGVEGKLEMWLALTEIADRHPPLAEADLDALVARARAQRDALNRERIAAGRRVLRMG